MIRGAVYDNKCYKGANIGDDEKQKRNKDKSKEFCESAFYVET